MNTMISELFKAIDSRDAERFVSFLSPDCEFVFGNLPAVTGIEEIVIFVAGFFNSLGSLSHEIEESWRVPDGMVCYGRVTYIRKDNSALTVPFANVMKLDSAGIRKYLIFADTSELYK